MEGVRSVCGGAGFGRRMAKEEAFWAGLGSRLGLRVPLYPFMAVTVVWLDCVCWEMWLGSL